MDFSRKFVSECREHSTYLKHVAAPLFRKSFTLSGAKAQGEIVLCGLGFYDLFVNGRKITKGFLAPYISNTDHIAYYDRYDIAPYLRQGENVIGIMLGDGFQNAKTRVWDFMDNVFNSAPKLALSVSLKDGAEELRFDATDFLCRKGPVWFNDLRSGVFYDRRQEPAGWTEPGFVEDGEWHGPIAAERPRGEARLDCQTGQALAIHHDIFTDGEKPEAFRRLVEIVHRDGDKVTCGFLGLRVIYHVLARFGEAELAYRMVTGREYPSYGYFIERGDTTVPEQFLPDEERRMSSQNHHFLADVSQWYIRYPGGINVRSSREVSIRPKFIESLTFAKARHVLPEGEVAVAWRREADRILLEVACPDSVSCEILLEDGWWFREERKAYLEKGAGRYEIVWKTASAQ